MATLLTLAGRSYTAGVGGAFTGGAVVQLQSDGTWTELASGGAVAWNLQNFVNETTHILFYISSGGFYTLGAADRGTLYRSIDQGQNWADVTPSSGGTEYVVDIAQDADGNLWCITDPRERIELMTGGPSRIYKSVDNGATWTLSHTIPDTSFTTRYWPGYNIACHPTDANIIVVEGTEMVNWYTRLWRTVDGGSNWSSAITPTFPSPPTSVDNAGHAKQHIFDYTSTGKLVYAGICESAPNNIFILRSADDGDSFSLYYSEAASAGYGVHFQESTLLYFLHHGDTFQVPLIFDAAPTKIADNANSPLTIDHDFHGISRHAISGVDTLHLGCNVGVPDAGATEDPSVFTRPADLSSGWVQHPQWDSMDSDLGYRLYVGIHGLVGATAYVPEVPRPRPPDSPPAGPGGPGAPPAPGIPGVPAIPGVAEPARGVAEPARGIAWRERREARRERRRRREQAAQEMALPERVPPFIFGDRIDKRQPISTVPRKIEPRQWLTFGWLSDTVLAGYKTLALRDWGDIEAQEWQRGQLAYMYDEPPSRGGNRLALLEITHTPYKVRTNELRNSDFNACGFAYAQAMGQRSPSGLTPTDIWGAWQTSPQEMWAVRFKVAQVYDQLAPERGTITG